MSGTESVTVRRATLADVPYIVGQGRKEFNQIGFLSQMAYEGVITARGANWSRPHNRLWIAEVNGDPVGFLYATPGSVGASLKVVQVCVQADARRIEYGQALVAAAEDYAARLQRPAVSCRVATDIEARGFWDALGYTVGDVVSGGKTRQRLLERRYKRLDCGLWIGDMA